MPIQEKNTNTRALADAAALRQASPARDFHGYGGRLPDPAWPGGARVAVSVVVNLEEGAELSILDGDERNEGTYEVRDEVPGHADPCAASHFEYGTRAGWWRVADLLQRAGIPATLSACGRSAERMPWLIADAVRRGFEVACHGWRWEPHFGMNEAAERLVIARCAQAVMAAGAPRPLGWHTRSAASANTRRLLAEAGFLYDSDSYADDLPYFVETAGRRHVVVPYAFDTNDMHFHQGSQRFALGEDFARYLIDAFDWLHAEGAHAPRMMSVGLHLRMIGRPGRIGGLLRALEHMQRAGQVWFATRAQIAGHWLERFA